MRSSQPGMQNGKFLEGALLGRPKENTLNEKHSTVRATRSWLKRNLDSVMHQIRSRQIEDPTMPKRPFMKNLLMDIDQVLEGSLDTERYEVRIHTAVDTVLDHAGGVDFWVELYDTQSGAVLSDYKIDLTANDSKYNPGQLADAVYYYDTDKSDLNGDKSMYSEPEYKGLVSMAADALFRKAKPYIGH